MARGFLSGLFWGAVASVGMLWLVSQLGGMIQLLTVPPSNVADRLPAASPPRAATPENPPEPPREQTAPATDPSRQAASLEQGQAETAPRTETAPAAVPQAAESVGAPEALPPETGAAPPPSPTPQPPAAPAGTAPAPPVPAADALPAVPTAPPPPQPAAPVEALVPAPQGPDADTAGRPGAEPAAPEPSPAAPPAAPAPAEAPPVVDFSQPQVVAPPAQDVAEAPPPGAGQGQEAPPQVAPPVAAGSPGRDAGGRDLKSDRLPVIGLAPADEPPAAPAPPEPPAPEDETPVPEGPAIEVFAAEFNNPAGLPLMAVLLLVDPADASPPEALPFPVSYAIDASQPGARAQMRRFREAGAEVVALTPLPPGAAPQDVEVLFAGYMANVPEAVAALDVETAEFQSSRAVAAQVAEALAADGRGMVTYSRGLNSAGQVAAKLEVPAGIVFRRFDSDGQDRAAIKRFLDQAAFRAGQRSGVIMVGHNRPETVAALLEWALGNRARTVTLAPVSAVLSPQ